MSFWAFWTTFQFICVIVNGCMILYNLSNYRRHHAKLFLGLLAWSAFFLLFSGAWMIYDAGKVSGVW